MIVLAVLLLVLALALVVYVVVSGANQTVSLEWEELNLAWEPTPLVVFLLGAVTLLLVVLALWMIRAGTKRGVAKRRELKRLREADRQRAAEARQHDQGADEDRREEGTSDARSRESRPTSPPRGEGGGRDDSWYDRPPQER